MNQLAIALLGGGFTLLVAIVTWLLAGWRDDRIFRRSKGDERVTRLEALYVSEVTLLERAIEAAQHGGPYPDFAEFAQSNAKLRLLSTRAIVDQMEVVGQHLYVWSTEQRAGNPKRVGDSGYSLISSGDSAHHRRAAELFPTMNNEIVRLIELMKNHLDELRKGLKFYHAA